MRMIAQKKFYNGMWMNKKKVGSLRICAMVVLLLLTYTHKYRRARTVVFVTGYAMGYEKENVNFHTFATQV